MGAPGMAGVRLLHCIDRQGADGVDAQRVQLLAGGKSLLARHHESSPCLEGTSSTDADGSALSLNNSLGTGSLQFSLFQFINFCQPVLRLGGSDTPFDFAQGRLCPTPLTLI